MTNFVKEEEEEGRGRRKGGHPQKREVSVKRQSIPFA
jgi:hypothetical protein